MCEVDTNSTECSSPWSMLIKVVSVLNLPEIIITSSQDVSGELPGHLLYCCKWTFRGMELLILEEFYIHLTG